MNRYPLWKHLLVLGVVVFGLLTALPNFYGSLPALQVGNSDGTPLDESEAARVERAIAGVTPAADQQYLRDGKLFATFSDIDTQSAAFEQLSALDLEGVSLAKTLAPQQPAWLRALGLSPMSLGLDLRGGVYLLYEVDLDDAVASLMKAYGDNFRVALRDADISHRVNVQNTSVIVQVRDAADLAAARSLVRDIDLNLVVSETDARSLRVSLSETQIRERQNFAIEQNMTSFRNRIDVLGVAEPVIQRQGLKRIVVQLPGIQDPNEAIRILGNTATLEFRLVETGAATSRGNTFPFIEGGVNRGEVTLKREVIASGDQIIDASAGFTDGSPSVSVRLDSVGGKRMLETTQANLQRPMGVLYIESERVGPDEEGNFRTVKQRRVINRANINGVFSTNFVITGLTANEAKDLSLLLKTGALAAPVFLVGQQTIGPSRGQDNIDRGFKAIQIGFLAVVIFMVFYYRVFGLIANLALLTNLVLIVGALSLLQASLTLPGIAGIVLTVGMAVDANVLIFERIREELAAGSGVQAAINSGYEKAFSSIADANITTFIAALVLFLFGTGPVKGFAVTLALGIATSMFTAIVGTRAVVNLIYGGRKLEKLAV
ncbi:MAG: protein translocase subunit SecD [Pseudomonadota bacterium]